MIERVIAATAPRRRRYRSASQTSVALFVFANLNEYGPATAKLLAARGGCSIHHVRRALHGLAVSYRTMPALVTPIERTRDGVVWSLTDEGECVAAAWKSAGGTQGGTRGGTQRPLTGPNSDSAGEV